MGSRLPGRHRRTRRLHIGRTVSVVAIGYIMGATLGAAVAALAVVASLRYGPRHVATCAAAVLAAAAAHAAWRSGDVVEVAGRVAVGGVADQLGLAAAVLLMVAAIEMAAAEAVGRRGATSEMDVTRR